MICFNSRHSSSAIRTLVLSVCLLLVTLQVQAQNDSQSFRLQYAAENDYLSAGTASWSLTNVDNRWVMQLATSPSRLVRMAGVGKVSETAVLSATSPPFSTVSYNYQDSKRKKKNYSAALSDSGDEIVITRSDQTITVPTGGGSVIDRLSATLAVAAELTENPDFESLNFHVLDRNGIRKVVFSNLGRETIRLGKNTIDTYVVDSARPGSTRKTRTWFATIGDTRKEQRLLPVKIEQHKNKDLVLRLSLIRYTLD